VVGCCEHGNEPSGFIKGREFLDYLSDLRFVAFPATEYDEVFSGYQPGQMVER
jgi:hypothetical protein